jgi:hypothetical protein
MKTIIFSLVICISTISNAQIINTNWSYQFDEFIQIKDAYYFNEVTNLQISSTIKKIVNHTDLVSNSNSFLGSLLAQQIESKELNIYKDESCTQQISDRKIHPILYDFNGYDSILTFHPETFEEDTIFLKSWIKQLPNDSTTYNIYQGWHFDKQTQQLYSQINKIAIEQIIDSTNLFYIKNEKPYTNPNENLLNDQDITWAKRVVIMCDFRNTEIEKYIFSFAHLEKHKILYRNDGYDLFRKISTDSFFLIENIKPHNIPSQYDKSLGHMPIRSDFQYYKIVQDFYYNDKTKTFSTRLIGICPSQRTIGEKGQIIWYNEDFWIIYDNSLKHNDYSNIIYNEWSGCGRNGWWK